MKKIISAAQMRAADQFTITNEPIASIDLMERASNAFVRVFKPLYNKTHKVLVVAGTGNNGGDALAITRLLRQLDYQVDVLLASVGELTPDCLLNLDRLRGKVQMLEKGAALPDYEADVIIDGLFGSGLNRPIDGWLAEMLTAVNEHAAPVVSIDIPSGLFADKIIAGAISVEAQHTITFQRPKLTFLQPESGRYCGQVHIVDIGLNEQFIEDQKSDFYWLEALDVKIKSRNKFDHKGVYGHLQVVAGSKGKLGAAFLAAKAAFRTGAGLCTVLVPACGVSVLQTNLPEAMVVSSEAEDHLNSGGLLDRASALCIGPGIGTHPETAKWFAGFLNQIKVPAVFDADAINLLSADRQLLKLVPPKSILTPHIGELNRLIDTAKNGLERIEKTKDLAKEHKVYVLIKGAYSAMVCPDGQVFFNTTGNPGMATAGSGDVLAGVIGALLAQGSDALTALRTGVYVHGAAGDLAKKELGEASIMASDLLKVLPNSISNVT